MKHSQSNDPFEKIRQAFSSSMSAEDVKAFAFSLSEILESASSLCRELWTKIDAGKLSDDEVEELLADIQHEIYHIDYHIHASKHLLPDQTPTDEELSRVK